MTASLVRTLAALSLMAITVVMPAPARQNDFSPDTSSVVRPSGQQPGASVAQDLTSVTEPLPPLDAVREYEGMIVRNIEFQGFEKDDLEHVRALVLQKPDQPLDPAKVRNSVLALFSTGRFADVQVLADRDTQNQLSLVFVATENYFVGLVNVEGVPHNMTSAQLVNACKLQLGELFTREKLHSGIDRMRLLLQENGYYGATIREGLEPDPATQQVNITLYVKSGVQAHVAEITVKGSPLYSHSELLEIAHIHPGDPVSSQLVNNALRRLRKRYQKKNFLEAQVSVTSQQFQPQSNAVSYVLLIQPGPTVDITVQGARVRRGVLKKYIPVYEEDAVDEDLLNEGRRNLRDYFQAQGYFDVEVNVRTDPDPGHNHLAVTYIVEKGIRHRLADLVITGNRSFPDDLIRERMQIQPAGRVFSRGIFSQALLANDVSRIEGLYQDNGFRQVKVNPRVEDNYKGEEGRIAVTFQIDEGPQTIVAALQIAGNNTIPTDQIMERIQNTVGQPYSDSKVSQDREAVLSEYFNRGFPNAVFQFSAIPSPVQPNQVNVSYTIKEGQQFFVNRILVDGLEHTRPYVVERDITVRHGDPISQQDMYESQQKLYELGIFNQVDTAVQNPDGEARDKNVLMRVQESKRYTFQYGVGLEVQSGQPAGANNPQGKTGASPRVEFAITRLNFRGRDHTISFKSHFGNLQQRALVRYDAPRLLNDPSLRLIFTALYDNTFDVLTFTSKRLEGSVQVSQSASRISTLLYGFTYRRVQATNLVVSSNLIPLLSQPVRVGMPTFTYIRDKRDNPIETHKGNYTTFDTGVAASFFGSQANFSRVLIQNSTYFPFKKNKRGTQQWVFARSTRIGIENLFGKNLSVQNLPGNNPSCENLAGNPAVNNPTCDVIPLPERFLAGGGNSHRGFGLNQAGPRDAASGEPLGGNAVFINNLELRTPPVSLPYLENNLSFAIFHDAGNVFTTADGMLKGLGRFRQDRSGCNLSSGTTCNFDYISQALGAGIRYKTPIGPLRFDLGYNLNPPVFPIGKLSPGQVVTGPACKPPLINIGGGTCVLPRVGTASHFNFYFSIGQTF